MDRILSTRIDDKFIRQINEIAKRMNTTKKAVIEKAVELLGQKVQAEKGADVFDVTCGVWDRKESPEDTVSKIRTTFRKSMHRYEQ